MKYIKLWLVILFLGLLGTASAQITFFEGTFEDAMAKAKKEKKNLFVDFYADWCGPCKMMSPIIDEIAEEMQESIKVGKVNVVEIKVTAEDGSLPRTKR